MSEITFPNHDGMQIKYPISISVDGGTTTYKALGDLRQKYTVYVDKWDDGWAVQETSDTGTGAIIATGCATKYEAVRWAILFIACSGGSVSIAD